MPFQIRREREREGEREREREREREKEKRKKKENLQPWLEKFHLISICMRVHDDDSTPYVTTAHEICCGNKSNHLDAIFDCLI